MVTLVKKISAKDIMGPVAKFVRENMEVGETLKCYGVAGKCSSIEEGTSNLGEWTRFVGEFQATNYVTGEVYRSGAVHVPSVLETHLKSGLEPMRDTVKDLKNSTVTSLTGEIEFAFIVSVLRNEDDEQTGGVSYEYITKPVTEIAKNDSIGHLTQLLEAPAEKSA